jgi:predicted RNA-binding Zn ribbon-like protein
MPYPACVDMTEYRTGMSQSASGRYGVTLGPPGLGLVQDFLNTASAGRPPKPDLLTDASDAQAWFVDALSLSEPLAGCEEATGPTNPAFGEDDLVQLREVRRFLRTVIGRRDRCDGSAHTDDPVEMATLPAYELGCPQLDAVSGTLALRLSLDGDLTVEPIGNARDRLLAALLTAVRDAHRDGTWRRLKVCRNGACSGAFYDRSRNNSGVWHDVKSCGNAANLRASRARRRQKDVSKPMPGSR